MCHIRRLVELATPVPRTRNVSISHEVPGVSHLTRLVPHVLGVRLTRLVPQVRDVRCDTPGTSCETGILGTWCETQEFGTSGIMESVPQVLGLRLMNSVPQVLGVRLMKSVQR